MIPVRGRCRSVRDTCRKYCNEQGKDFVTIHQEKMSSLADKILEALQIDWDEENWHYNPPADRNDGKERLAMYILALDAINFCFWPTERYEYEQISTTLTKMAEYDHDQPDLGFLLSPDSLSTMTSERMADLFRTFGDDKIPPDIDVRCRLWNEVGTVLNDQFDASALKFLEQAQGSAPALVDLVVHYFPGFRDTCDDISFLKRAQILVGDWNASMKLELSDMATLTTFADYRVPQLLREEGVLEYATDLALAVDGRQEIAENSPWEWSIRASTVVAVEDLVACANAKSDRTLTDVEVDWFLW